MILRANGNHLNIYPKSQFIFVLSSTYLEIRSVKDIETETKALLFLEQNESRVTKTDAIETVKEQLLKQSVKNSDLRP